MTVLTVLTVQPVDIVETENTVVTVEIVETEETVLIEDLKKYELPKNSVVLLTANMDTRDASASKKCCRTECHPTIQFLLKIKKFTFAPEVRECVWKTEYEYEYYSAFRK